MNYQSLREQTTYAILHDVLALQMLSKLCDRYIPCTNASLRPSAILLLVNDIVLNHRTRVVEFGTGISTVYLSAAVAQNGGQVISFDHDAQWQSRVAEWLPDQARSAVSLTCAPLRPMPKNDQETSEWYDTIVVSAALGAFGSIDLVLFDGPPACQESRSLARRPGLSFVRPYLNSSATIVLDDINRKGEQTIAHEWSITLNHPYTDLTVRAGVALWSFGSQYNTVL
jgi:predicted O-methyltransferase YrrM